MFLSEKKCVAIYAVIHTDPIIRVQLVQHMAYIHTAAYERANIALTVIHAVWSVCQRFDSVIFAIVDTGNVATTKPIH